MNDRITLKPLILSLSIVVLDQLTKFLISIKIPLNSYEDIIRVTKEFLWIVHVRNTGAAFSFGASFENATRISLLLILPSLFILYLIYIVVFSGTWSMRYKYLLASIIGGGTGNMIDRIFRPDGVVDFISVKFYGLFGFERWPTFNVADSSVVVPLVLWLVFAFISIIPKKSRQLDRTS